MKIDIHSTDKLLVDYAKEIEEVLRRAGRQAMLEHKRAGVPIVSWENEEVVIIQPEDIQIDESPAREPAD